MSFVENDGLNLSNLPSDIIRRIILAGPEFIDNTILISRRWNHLINDHLSIKNRRPIIKFLRWINCYGSDGTMINVHIPINQHRYFGVENWNHRLLANGCIETFRHSRLRGDRIDDFSELFRRCSRIGMLEFALNGDARNDNMIAIGREMANDTVEEITIAGTRYLNDSFQSSILDFLRAHPVRRLVLSHYICSTGLDSMSRLLSRDTCGPFFFDASRLVTEVVIEKNASNRQSFSKYWQRVIAALNQTEKVKAQLVVEDDGLGEVLYRAVMVARD